MRKDIMQSPYHLSAQHVSFHFGRRTVLDDISLDLEPGSITGLVGENGAGKSTFIRIISGDLYPTKGIVTVNNIPVYSLPCRARVFGVTAEAYGYPTNLRAKDIFLYYQMALKISKKRVDYFVDLFNMQNLCKKHIKKLSTGENKKVCLILALLSDSPILLLDEPFTGLDVASTQITRELIIQAKNEGKSILLVTHLFPELEKLASSSYLLFNQHLTLMDNASEEDYMQLTHSKRSLEPMAH